VIEDQRNGFAKIRQAFLTRLALAVRARNLGTIGDVPGAVLLYGRREFTVHVFILTSWNGGDGSPACDNIAVFWKGQMSLVKVTTKYQVTIPNVLRRKMGVGAGDTLEAKVERGKITLTPKPDSDPEYTPQQRRVIDARLARALAEVRQDRTAGPFETVDATIASMKRELTKRSARKRPKPVR
jgi:AbrB family looped-hinge helix DNA binding protein